MTNHHTDPAAVSPLTDRAERLYAVYGGADAQAQADARDAASAARLRLESMAAADAAAFAAPVVIDDQGRLL